VNSQSVCALGLYDVLILVEMSFTGNSGAFVCGVFVVVVLVLMGCGV